MDLRFFLLIFALLSFLSLVVILIFYARRKKYLRHILIHSERLRYVLDVSSRYTFNEVDNTLQLPIRCVISKSAFDRFDFERAFDAALFENECGINEYFCSLRENVEQVRFYDRDLKYAADFMPADDIRSAGFNVRLYHFLEEETVMRNVLNPVCDGVAVIPLEYTSKAGRNRYYAEKCFSLYDYECAVNRLETRLAYEKSHEFQRRLMTRSLRYDILKRDGFCCVLCGRSAKDGVKLHVDHIIPIARGGQTQPDNLRTLCSDCNFGKSDKYDPFDMN